MNVPIMADLAAQGKTPEILFWVGCAGSFDARAQKITIAFTKIMNKAGIDFAILGKEESCTGDPARRAGNEFLFQMMALQNIETLKMYKVKKIVTICPHCFNTLKNEYPDLGGNYEVIHHTVFLQQLIDEGKLEIKTNEFNEKKVVYHDSCYLGRSNDIYDEPRAVLGKMNIRVTEMAQNREHAMCCGAGGAQMFKEEEKGDIRINEQRAKDAVATGAKVISVNCPYCTTMLEDGVKAMDKQEEIEVLDIAEMIVRANDW